MSILDFLNQSQKNENNSFFFYDFDTKTQNPCSSNQPKSHEHHAVVPNTEFNLVQQKLIPALFPIIPSNNKNDEHQTSEEQESTSFVSSRCHCCDLLNCAQNAISLDAGWCTAGDLFRNIASHDATNNNLDFASRLDAVLKVQSFQENVGLLTQNDIASNIFMLGSSKRNHNNTAMSRDELYALVKKRRIAAMKLLTKNQQNNTQNKQDSADIFVSPSLQSSQSTQPIMNDNFLEPFDLLLLPSNKNVADDGFLVPTSFTSSGGIPPKRIPNINNNNSTLLLVPPTLKDESVKTANMTSSASGVMMKLPPSLLLIAKTKAPPPYSSHNSVENNNVFSKTLVPWNTKKMPNLVNSNFLNNDDSDKKMMQPSLPAPKPQQFRSLLACEESEFDEEEFLKKRARDRQKQQQQQEVEKQKVVANIVPEQRESFIDDNTLTDIDVKILLKREKEEAELKNTFFKFVVNSNNANKNKNKNAQMMMMMKNSERDDGEEGQNDNNNFGDQTDSLLLQQDSSPMRKKNVFIPQLQKKSQEELDYFSGGDGVLNLKTGQITVPVQKTKKEPKPKKAPKEKKIATNEERKKKKVPGNKKIQSKKELPKRRPRKENDESESSEETSDDSRDSDSDDSSSSSSSEETDSDDIPLVKMFKK